MHSDITVDYLLPFGVRVPFTKGGVCFYDQASIQSIPRDSPFSGLIADEGELQGGGLGARQGYYGWVGMGGQVMNYHPEKQVGFGLAVADLFAMDVGSRRGGFMQQDVIQCIDEID